MKIFLLLIIITGVISINDTCPAGYQSKYIFSLTLLILGTTLDSLKGYGNADVANRIINYGNYNVGCIYDNRKFSYSTDFKVIFNIDVLNGSIRMDGIVIVISKSMTCNTTSEGQGGNNAYNNESGLIVGELDLFKNTNDSIADLSQTTISLKECMIGTCTAKETGASEQKVISNNVSVNILYT